MYCYCGTCPQDIPRREAVEFICHKCAKPKEGWMDVNITLGKCNTCERMAFCHILPIKQDWEKEYM